MEPRASRPRFPAEYGVPSNEEGLLPWSHVDERMESAENYWVSSVGPDGAPHTRPVGGMWLDQALYFAGSLESRWSRNLAANPLACVHLSEEGDRAVILHGRADTLRPDRALANRLVEASNAKYDYGQTVEQYEKSAVIVFRPRVVYAWDILFKDATRWDCAE